MPLKTTSQPNLSQALKQGVDFLRTHHITSAWLEAELLLALITKKSRAFIIAHDEIKLTRTQAKRYQALLKKRAQHYPLAYLLGHKEFYSLDFLVSQAVLVPRPESELLVEQALEVIKNTKKDYTLLDIGTGSGCLIISILKNLPLTAQPLQALALDISPQALAIARKNSRQHKTTSLQCIKSNLLSALLNKPTLLKKSSALIILANLPYLTTLEIKNEPSIKKEPQQALAGGKNGLELYAQLAQQVKILQTRLAIPITILAEINPQQKNNFQKLWSTQVDFKKDLNKKTRLGIINLS